MTCVDEHITCGSTSEGAIRSKSAMASISPSSCEDGPSKNCIHTLPRPPTVYRALRPSGREVDWTGAAPYVPPAFIFPAAVRRDKNSINVLVAGLCVCVWKGRGKNNIIQGGPYGSKAPVVAWGASKSMQTVMHVMQLSCLAPARVMPRLSQNLWGMGV